uniref:Uncharacterized protein n=1 Tax=Daphnia galeata TaxID=27404 RepID=A0A8J2RNQ7_9CRUS|nr:unnamed protein product [Daphnia galeata]
MTTRLKTQTKTQNKHPHLSQLEMASTLTVPQTENNAKRPSGSNTEGWVEGEDRGRQSRAQAHLRNDWIAVPALAYFRSFH